jgi:hypothetical protein
MNLHALIVASASQWTLCEAKTSKPQRYMAFEDSGGHRKRPKVTDAVIEASYLLNMGWRSFQAGRLDEAGHTH